MIIRVFSVLFLKMRNSWSKFSSLEFLAKVLVSMLAMFSELVMTEFRFNNCVYLNAPFMAIYCS